MVMMVMATLSLPSFGRGLFDRFPRISKDRIGVASARVADRHFEAMLPVRNWLSLIGLTHLRSDTAVVRMASSAAWYCFEIAVDPVRLIGQKYRMS